MLFSTEKSFLEVAPRPLLLDGSIDGILSIAGACQLKVGQKIYLISDTELPLQVKINQFIDDLSFYVGAPNKGVNDRIDVSAYLASDNSNISARKQPRPSIPQIDVLRYVYSEEPAMALRNVLVDSCGTVIDENNPLAVNPTPNIVDISAQITKIEINPTTWTLLERSGSTSPIGTGPLISRQVITIQNTTGQDIIIQYDNATTDNTISILIPDGVERIYDFGSNIQFYAKSVTSNVDLVYEEGS